MALYVHGAQLSKIALRYQITAVIVDLPSALKLSKIALRYQITAAGDEMLAPL